MCEVVSDMEHVNRQISPTDMHFMQQMNTI
jgi:hypothetical protein